MPRKILNNKPLIEAIFELRWELEDRGGGLKADPHYKILIGSLYSKLKDIYPHHELLPAASIPDDVAGHIIQHRFRKGKDAWPLVQMGPGILTVNDTEGYVWEDFEKQALQVIKAFLEIYPEPNKLSINSLLLRYIDAVEFDFETRNIYDFLAGQMKTEIKLYPKLFDATEVGSTPSSFDWRFSYPCKKPEGLIHLRFVKGKKENKDALIWETMVQSMNKTLSPSTDEINAWLGAAHDLTDDWFFKLIDGELEKRFT